jgi:hypothetical protein
MSTPKRFVYILKSVNFPDEYYVGVMGNVSRPGLAHEGVSPATAEHRPWRTLM